jgi:hypothetical protein
VRDQYTQRTAGPTEFRRIEAATGNAFVKLAITQAVKNNKSRLMFQHACSYEVDPVVAVAFTIDLDVKICRAQSG